MTFDPWGKATIAKQQLQKSLQLSKRLLHQRGKSNCRSRRNSRSEFLDLWGKIHVAEVTTTAKASFLTHGAKSCAAKFAEVTTTAETTTAEATLLTHGARQSSRSNCGSHCNCRSDSSTHRAKQSKFAATAEATFLTYRAKQLRRSNCRSHRDCRSNFSTHKAK